VSRFDYVTVGHVTVDEMTVDGSRRPGGGAFYSALQGARLGLRTQIVTQGAPRELEQLLEPYRAELDVRILPAEHTTTLSTSGVGAARSQRLLAWAGPIAQRVAVDTSILHLAPIAQETPGSWSGQADFVGVTPQGLVRRWDAQDGRLALVELEDGLLPARWDAIVISRSERASFAALLAQPRSHGSIIVTAGAEPAAIHLADGTVLHSTAPQIDDDPRDDLGAGDVFAAAFFIALHEGVPAAEAAVFANAAAGVRIAGAGPNAVGDRQRIEARLQDRSRSERPPT
jgi:sugar/nucleoside kinase (ribokinase family)